MFMNADNEKNNVFADRLRELRKNAGLSQETAAAELGVARETYSRYEAGMTTKRGQEPRISQLNKICDFFGCDAGYLCGQYNSTYISQPDISASTGLTNKSVNFLIRNKDNACLCTVLNYLLENPALLCDISEFIFKPHGGIYSDSYNYGKFRLTEDVIRFCDDIKREYTE